MAPAPGTRRWLAWSNRLQALAAATLARWLLRLVESAAAHQDLEAVRSLNASLRAHLDRLDRAQASDGQLRQVPPEVVEIAPGATELGPFASVPGLEDGLERARAAFLATLSRYRDEIGLVRFPSPLALGQEHVRGAALYAHRLHYLDDLPKDAVCAEIGVWKGDFSAEILRRTRPRRLHLFDLDFGRFKVRERFGAEALSGQVEFHEGDSARTVPKLADGSLDWAYIDAGHDYESVRRDAENAARKLKPGGVLIFNDYMIWSHTEGRPYGVVFVVNEMCVMQRWQVAAFCLQNGMYCDIAITRADNNST